MEAFIMRMEEIVKERIEALDKVFERQMKEFKRELGELKRELREAHQNTEEGCQETPANISQNGEVVVNEDKEKEKKEEQNNQEKNYNESKPEKEINLAKEKLTMVTGEKLRENIMENIDQPLWGQKEEEKPWEPRIRCRSEYYWVQVSKTEDEGSRVQENRRENENLEIKNQNTVEASAVGEPPPPEPPDSYTLKGQNWLSMVFVVVVSPFKASLPHSMSCRTVPRHRNGLPSAWVVSYSPASINPNEMPHEQTEHMRCGGVNKEGKERVDWELQWLLPLVDLMGQVQMRVRNKIFGPHLNRCPAETYLRGFILSESNPFKVYISDPDKSILGQTSSFLPKQNGPKRNGPNYSSTTLFANTIGGAVPSAARCSNGAFRRLNCPSTLQRGIVTETSFRETSRDLEKDTFVYLLSKLIGESNLELRGRLSTVSGVAAATEASFARKGSLELIGGTGVLILEPEEQKAFMLVLPAGCIWEEVAIGTSGKLIAIFLLMGESQVQFILNVFQAQVKGSKNRDTMGQYVCLLAKVQGNAEGKLLSLSKKADDVMSEQEKTEQHISDFADFALRTLIHAYHELNEEEYNQFKRELTEAKNFVSAEHEHIAEEIPNGEVKNAIELVWRYVEKAAAEEASVELPTWVILGHYEQRQILNKISELVGDKAAYAFLQSLKGSSIGEAIFEIVSLTFSVAVSYVRSILLHTRYNSLQLFYEHCFGESLILRATISDGLVAVEDRGIEVSQGLWTKGKQCAAMVLANWFFPDMIWNPGGTFEA